MIAAATQLLRAFARSDLESIERLCADDVLLVGTDENELWSGRGAVLESFAGAFDLEVDWVDEPTAGSDWLFGHAVFRDRDGSSTPVRVTMVFRDGVLVHGHYSVAASGA
jgi:hypothetical protein